ncbi:MAG: STAS domain-containing protein [Thermodesulfobacteriota bacterium]|nr:STAS domain-containing protein [Thermodesulfobacteriota bacterium]
MSEIIKQGDRIIVKPGRDIVASTAEDLKAELKQALDEGAANLTIDLSDVEMVDSMGLGVLIAAHNSLRKKESSLTLINPSVDILKLLKNMRLDQHFLIL